MILPRLHTVLATVLLSALSLGAAPARPVKHTATLPDGSTVTYRTVGNEHFHYFITDDGHPLVLDGESLYFAQSDAEGRMVSTGVLASDAAYRSTDTQKMLQSLDAEAIIEKATAALPSRESGSLMRAPSRAPESMSTTTFPITGSPRGLVILVQFRDVKFTLSDPKSLFNDMLNKEGFNSYKGTGSARDYFIASSCGVFTPQFDVYGPITVPNTQEYYGGNTPYQDANSFKLAIHACNVLDAQGFDFSPYDCDGDGIIDNVYIFYAGKSESTGNTADVNCIWPHSYNVVSGFNYQNRWYPSLIEDGDKGENYYDGLLLNHYACSNELESANYPDGIGTFCHEFSHVMGLPDLYYTGSNNLSINTPNSWSILDVGCYLNDSRTPPYYSSFERMSLGWMTPTVIDRPGEYTLEPLHESNSAYLVQTEVENEFFLFENRQREDWDAYLAGKGMLVWHIDYNKDIWANNEVNNKPAHQYVDLIEAVSRTSLYPSAYDPFPGAGNVTEYTASTTPRFQSWAHKDPGYPLTNIRQEGRNILFTAGNPDDSGIDDILTDGSVTIAGGNSITITGSELPATVYTLMGAQVYSGSARTIDLPAGLYIVKVGTTTAKVTVF